MPSEKQQTLLRPCLHPPYLPPQIHIDQEETELQLRPSQL